jgi:hypothetical protein
MRPSPLKKLTAFFERFADKHSIKTQPFKEPTDRVKAVIDCEVLVNQVQSLLDRKYHPLEGKLYIVRTIYPNINDFTKFLNTINARLREPKVVLLGSDFPQELATIQLDSFFISRDDRYIPQSAIGEFVAESTEMLGHLKVLAEADNGPEEYHYRMLMKTIISLTSIHGALLTVLAN